jgi:membrane-bound serine protease (ClpP class)
VIRRPIRGSRQGSNGAPRLHVRLGVALGLTAAMLLAGGLRAASPEVVLLPTTGTVDSVMAAYIAEGVASAEREGAAAVVIELNTLGGDLSATQQIVSTLLEAKVPTIVWVAPSGAKAASAGTFITLAGAVALMAPGTNIGAASPVGQGGADITGTEGQKVKNDAIAYITSIANTRGRNVAWAVSTVETARSSAASEAVSLGAVDGIAATIDDVIKVATGKVVDVAGTKTAIDLTGASVREVDMNPFQGFLHLLSDPNVAFILFTLGFYGLLAEIWHPNFVTGTLGGLSIILAFVGFGSLPLNVAGLLLIGLALVLFFLEPHVLSHGILTFAGLVCFVLGASALYTAPVNPEEPLVGVAAPIVITMTLTTAAFLGLITWFAVRSRGIVRTAGMVGSSLAAGSAGIVKRPLEPTGSVFVAGEEWSARTPDGRVLQRGTPVRVVGVDRLVAIVEPDTSSSSSSS